MSEKKPQFKTLNIEDIRYRTTLTNKFINRAAYTPVDKTQVSAFIPGTILKVHVKKGKRVREGDVLLTLEAMKMNNMIQAPISGTVKAVNVKEGQTVTKKDVLVEIKPSKIR